MIKYICIFVMDNNKLKIMLKYLFKYLILCMTLLMTSSCDETITSSNSQTLIIKEIELIETGNECKYVAYRYDTNKKYSCTFSFRGYKGQFNIGDTVIFVKK